MKKTIATTLIIACAFVAGAGKDIQAGDSTIHKVQEGDTLWDLSEGYFHDPLLWPEIWKNNPNIKNPNRIYPGQGVKIPVFSVQSSTAPAFSGEAAVSVKPENYPGVVAAAGTPPVRMIEKAVPVNEGNKDGALQGLAKYYDRGIGSVTSDLPQDGRVLSTREGWRHAASGEVIAIDAPGARVGQQFGVYRDMGKVDPLSFWGRSPGHLLADVAIMEVVSSEAGQQRALIIRSFTEVQEGDLLGDVAERPTVISRTSSSGRAIGSGSVVAVNHLREFAGIDDVAYLDFGGNQGLAPGDILVVKGTEGNLQRNGSAELLILRVTPTTAAGVVTGRSTQEVRRGDKAEPTF